ncbi:phosphatase PAP2 family protein [Candidatus Bathyarchaeota archaeon]|nr:phosphatase PAP2 family protein [Candidatus Bathyarchaeota archaeon]
MLYMPLRDVVHIVLCVASIIVYGRFGIVVGSLLTGALLLTYLLNEYMRVRGVSTYFTRLYKHMLTERESVNIAKSPLFLGISVLVLMCILPFEKALTVVFITGLGDGFAGLLRTLGEERSKNLWRVKTSLASFTITALTGSLFYEPYTVLVACVASTMVEALILKIDDNLTIPFTASTSIYLSEYVGFNSTLKSLIEELDFSIYLTIREWWLSNPINTLTPLFMALDMILPLTYFAFAFLTLFRRRKPIDVITLIVLALTTSILIRAVKELFRRHRPPASIKQDYGFPSNHAALAGVFTGFFYNSPKWSSIFIYTISVLTVLEVLALGNHWFSDVVVGFLIGLFVTLPFNSSPL